MIKKPYAEVDYYSIGDGKKESRTFNLMTWEGLYCYKATLDFLTLHQIDFDVTFSGFNNHASEKSGN